MNSIVNIVNEIRVVAGQMSPYLLFGFLAAGLLHIFVSAAWMQRHLGGRGLLPVIKSVLLGVPLPLCSCGVIAVTASIRKQGAGRGAATGFLLATPQTGVDSILATWGMLGPVLGIIRPLVALITGIVGGALVSLFDDEKPVDRGAKGSEASAAAVAPRTLREALYYGLVTLPRDIAKPLIVGIILAGLVAALIPRGVLTPYIGGGLAAMVIMTVVGIPLYVCATASIPVALSFIHLGASPGAALVFLIAGPATNAATIATVWKVMGRKTTAIYLATVAVGGIAAGLLYDALISLDWIVAGLGHAHEHAHHGEGTGWANVFFAVLLAVVVLNSLYGSVMLQKMRDLFGRGASLGGQQGMAFSVSGMTCSHCAGAVAQKLRAMPEVQEVHIDLAAGKANIIGAIRNPERVVDALREIGYTATLLNN